MTLLTVHQRIREAAEMTGSHPCLRVHQDRTVNADIVRILLNKLLPPCSLDVILQFDAQIAVVPCICKSAVNLRSRIYETS